MIDFQFTKMHGLGNDFIIIDKTENTVLIDQHLVSTLSNRKTGIGCDQILVIENLADQTNTYNYSVFNSDGSEADHCGNGARCVIKYIIEKYNLEHSEINLLTKTRKITGSIDKTTGLINVSMGVPLFNPSAIPFSHKEHPDNSYELELGDIQITCGVVSIGNPHVIIKLFSENELDDAKSLSEIAKTIQTSKYFPKSVNVNFYIKLDDKNIKLVTFERGCGFTLACGTGACATVAYGISQNELQSPVNVIMPGGKLEISWDKKNELKMLGSATAVFRGNTDLEQIIQKR